MEIHALAARVQNDARLWSGIAVALALVGAVRWRVVALVHAWALLGFVAHGAGPRAIEIALAELARVAFAPGAAPPPPPALVARDRLLFANPGKT